MGKAWGWGVLMCAIAVTASAEATRDRGKAAAQSVLNQWGSADTLQAKAFTPMASDAPMATIDGETRFEAQMTCPGSKRFLQLTLVPNGTGDIDALVVSMDMDLDGTPEQTAALKGPFGALCDNGIVQCDAGTMNNCRYHRWQVDATGVQLNPTNGAGYPNSVKDMGACYCFNNACGNSLLLQNAEKILDDAGAGIAIAMAQTVPRFGLSSKTMIDTTSAEFFGQTAGCGADQRPEQFYQNTAGLETLGAAAQGDPNSTYNKVLSSTNAQGHGTTAQSCQINRNIALAGYWNDAIVTAAYGGDGKTTSCGTGCVKVRVGRVGDNYLSAKCGKWTSYAAVTVHRPELLTSVTLVQTSFDDWLRVRINGNIVYNADPNWTWESARCGENGQRGTKYPNTDLTSWFKNVPAGTVVQVVQETSYTDKGEGWAILQFQYAQDCAIASETLSNGCAAQEENPECALRDEQVDGVQTYQGYTRTGLTPSPASKTYTYNGCEQTLTREFFSTQRIYTCPASPLPYDGEAAQKRYDSIHGTFDTATGAFTDVTTKDGGSTYTASAQRITTPPPDSRAACPMMCRTRKPRPGVAVGEPGPTNALNPGGVAYDYTWRECDEGNLCPTAAGEEVVTACGCRDNFGEAAAAMQTIRQVAEDSVCQAR